MRKTGVEHVVPLSQRCLAILEQARALNPGSALIFPGKLGRLSDVALLSVISPRDATVHGFRSSFKDWAAETGVRDEVSEVCLAHTDQNRVRAAYRRTSFDTERRQVMQDWAEHCGPR
jgi:integrase